MWYACGAVIVVIAVLFIVGSLSNENESRASNTTSNAPRNTPAAAERTPRPTPKDTPIDSESDPPTDAESDPPLLDAESDPPVSAPTDSTETESSTQETGLAADYLPGDEANGLTYDFYLFDRSDTVEGEVTEEIWTLEVYDTESVGDGRFHVLYFDGGSSGGGKIFLYSEGDIIKVLPVPPERVEAVLLDLTSGDITDEINVYLEDSVQVFGEPDTSITEEKGDGTEVEVSFYSAAWNMNSQIICHLTRNLNSGITLTQSYTWEKGTGLVAIAMAYSDSEDTTTFYTSYTLRGYTRVFVPPDVPLPNAEINPPPDMEGDPPVSEPSEATEAESTANNDWSDYDIRVLGPEVPPIAQALAQAIEQTYGNSVSYETSASASGLDYINHLYQLSVVNNMPDIFIITIPDDSNSAYEYIESLGIQPFFDPDITLTFDYVGSRWSFVVRDAVEHREFFELLFDDFSNAQSPMLIAFMENYNNLVL